MRIETDRLILRPLEPGDADDYIAMMLDPRVAQFLTPDGVVRSRADEWRAFAMMLGHLSIRGFSMFAVEEKTTGDWIGRVGPWQPEGWPSLECGWGIKAEYWGRGYAPEAAIAAVNWMFETFPELDRVISLIDPDNANSQAVARKIGEAKSDERFVLWDHELDIWAASRDEWLKRFGKM